MLRIIIVLIISSLSLQAIAAPKVHRPFTIDRTEVIDFHAKANGKDYEVYVKLPESYAKNAGKKFPLLVLTDGYYAFPLVSSINWRMTEHNQVYEQSIIVGISYPKGQDDHQDINKNRADDFTPPLASGKKSNSDETSGRSNLYVQFIAEELLPYLLSHYSVDATRKIYAGHSYGGLLGTYMLFTQPNLFDYYLIGSPSLWFGDNIMFTFEADYAKTHKDLAAKVFMATGADEESAKNGMVSNMLALDKQLKERHYPQISLTTRVIPDEGHLSGYPAFITQGLHWAIPLKN